jgi:uncharacterized Zn finger protein
MSEEHECPHPVDFIIDEKGRELTVWICQECGAIWEARLDIYWAPSEDDNGNRLTLSTYPKKEKEK